MGDDMKVYAQPPCKPKERWFLGDFDVKSSDALWLFCTGINLNQILTRKIVRHEGEKVLLLVIV